MFLLVCVERNETSSEPEDREGDQGISIPKAAFHVEYEERGSNGLEWSALL